MISGSHDRDRGIDRAPEVSLFRSLGDPTRLAIALCPPHGALSGNAHQMRDVSSSHHHPASGARSGDEPSPHDASDDALVTDPTGLVRGSAIPAGIADVAAA